MRPAFVLSLLLIAACSDAALPTATTPVAQPSVSPTTAPTGPPVIVPTIAFVVGPDLKTMDHPVFLQRPGEAPMQVASGVQLTAASNVLLTTKYPPGTVTATTVTGGRTYFEDFEVQGESPQKAAVVGEILYLATSRRIIAVDPSGSSRTLPVPSALPTTAPKCPPIRRFGYDPSRSFLYAIAAAQGHVFVYVASPTNGQIVDLQDGRRLDLIDAGYALSMITGSDDKLYVATVDSCPSSTVVVRRIDPATMREEAAVDSGRPPRPGRMHLIAAHGGGVYLLETTDTTTQLLRVDVAGSSPTALPPDSGSFSAAAPDGTLYLFGGRARNIVTRFDPATSTLTRVDAARGPAGSFVGALFFLRRR